uniref:Uncharacterized protein n=1 Tax=Salix viminalis TaxID=40686 RepID=A0A6N2LNW0_SALVM
MNRHKEKIIQEIIKTMLNRLDPIHLQKQLLCNILKQDDANINNQSWFGLGSRAIITTRDEILLLKVDRTYRVEKLERDESFQLFCWHAFRNTKPEKDCVDLSNDIVEHCGGLPLAFERGRWEDVIDKLRRIPNLDIQKKLRISFCTLYNVVQNAFPDIVCFFVGRKKGYVEKVLETLCGYNPEVD